MRGYLSTAAGALAQPGLLSGPTEAVVNLHRSTSPADLVGTLVRVQVGLGGRPREGSHSQLELVQLTLTARLMEALWASLGLEEPVL